MVQGEEGRRAGHGGIVLILNQCNWKSQMHLKCRSTRVHMHVHVRV